MTNHEFVNKAKEIYNLNTIYSSGTFLNKYTESFLQQKIKQYPKWYTPQRQAAIRAKASKGPLYMADCCGLIKGIIWGFPNIKYASGGLADVNDSGIWVDYCVNRSCDFSNIIPGDILHLPGHVGIYIGDGKAIECTPKWDNCVQVTAVSNIQEIPGLHSREWEAFGRFKLLDYEKKEESFAIDYIVQKNDCLSIIAKKFNTSVAELMRINPEIKNPDLIFTGQKIHIKL